MPSRIPTLRTLVAAATVALAGLVSAPVATSASGAWPVGADGMDVSWPQCGSDLPSLPHDNFAVVGVNGGRPYTMNPCFADEFRWMEESGGTLPSVYINLEYGESPAGQSLCPARDRMCRAYDFGFSAAEDAFMQAYELTDGHSLDTSTWWLDVETENYWADPAMNRQVIQGARDYLLLTGHPVGVYSTGLQWQEITGGWNAGPDVGNWIAGAGSLQDYSMCFESLWEGAPVWMIQYLNTDRDLDENHSC